MRRTFRPTFEYFATDPAAPYRFWSRVQRTDGCWLWTGGGKQNRYGRFQLRNDGERQPLIKPSQYSWMLENGRDVPPGMEVCHSCDVPLCVRPDHLYVATHRDNMRDAARKGLLSKPRVRVLSFEQRDEIRQLRRDGAKLSDLARRFGVSSTTIKRHSAVSHA